MGLGLGFRASFMGHTPQNPIVGPSMIRVGFFFGGGGHIIVVVTMWYPTKTQINRHWTASFFYLKALSKHSGIGQGRSSGSGSEMVEGLGGFPFSFCSFSFGPLSGGLGFRVYCYRGFRASGVEMKGFRF